MGEESVSALQDDVVELQTRVVFQEDVIQKLDAVVVQQAERLDRLQRRLTELEDQLGQMRYDGRGPAEIADEKPPHY